MIELRKTGNIFDCGAQAIVNPVNCVGTMGSGLALEFKRRYPAMNKEYVRLCKTGQIKVGQVWVWHEHELPCNQEPCKYVVNFPTKDHWRAPSQIEWIETGLDDMKNHAIMGHVTSLALPALGCGLGGLKFDAVHKLVYQKFADDVRTIILFEPQ